ncbi:MAG TPA: FecR family protein [Myxococcota bacterium]|nr:FecR family protein [Myxococcota bacterium]
MSRCGQAIGLGALALALVAARAAPAPVPPRVHSVIGVVELSSPPGAPWRPAQVGDSLAPGAALRTGAGARAELVLDGALARLYEISLARLPADPAARRRIELERGAASFDVQPDDSAPFQVDTPGAVALAKGTRFTVTADGELSTVSVGRGLVGVRAPESLAREVLVHPGFGVMGGAGRPFALGLLNQKGDPWETWSRGAAPSRPLQRAGQGESPASADAVEAGPAGDADVAIRILEARGPRRVQIVGTGGIDATFTRRDLSQVLRGNSAVLGPPLLATLHARGVTPSAFARQVLDNL